MIGPVGGEAPDPTPDVDPKAREAVRRHFDMRFYLDSNPDVRESGVEPLDHFMLHGWRQQRDPSRSFSIRHYLAQHGDVAAAGINPLLHYAYTGQSEGRSVRRPLDAERRQLEASMAPSLRAPAWRAAADASPAMSAAALRAALQEGEPSPGTILSVSHDQYALHCGGIQSVIATEQLAFAAAGFRYVHVSPASPLPMLAEAGPATRARVHLWLDGTRIGIAVLQQLIDVIAAERAGGRRFELVVHHLMGHAPEHVASLAAATGRRPAVWVHDYFTLCPSYALMRNDIRHCGAPPPASPACTVCTFGPGRASHATRMQAFFEATRPHVLAPSAPALEGWQRACANAAMSLPAQTAEAVPIGRLTTTESDSENAPPCDSEEPLRVAFLGTAVTHKGWTVFEELAIQMAGDPRYVFYQLGAAPGTPVSGHVRMVPVCVSPGQEDAMVDAVARHRIDVVLCWSLWPETFCFTLHEALAGGAFVIARGQAGNVWPAIRDQAPGQGLRIDTEAELRAVFQSGEIVWQARLSPRAYGAVVRSGATADWMHLRDERLSR